MLINRTYYTLEDLLTNTGAGGYNEMDIKRARFGNGKKTFSKLLEDYTDILAASQSSEFKTAEVETLWTNYIVPRMMDHAIWYTDEEELTYTQVSKFHQIWLSHFCNVIMKTYKKYKQLIDLYHANNLDLMKDIKSNTTSKYNDTPQASQTGFDWSSDNHLSNINSSETGSAGGTPIERMDEIRKGYDNIYGQWITEFNPVFMED